MKNVIGILESKRSMSVDVAGNWDLGHTKTTELGLRTGTAHMYAEEIHQLTICDQNQIVLIRRAFRRREFWAKLEGKIEITGITKYMFEGKKPQRSSSPLFHSFISRNNQVQMKAIRIWVKGRFGQCEKARQDERSDLGTSSSISKPLVSGKCAICWDEVYYPGFWLWASW